MATPLLCSTPIASGGSPIPAFWSGSFQAVEGQSYLSLPGPSYLPDTDTAYKLAGGSLPNGLSISGDGTVSGTVSNFMDGVLIDAITAYPSSTTISGADQGSHTLGSGAEITKKFEFVVEGKKSSTGSTNAMPFEITVIKFWENDLSEYDNLSIEDKSTIGAKE